MDAAPTLMTPVFILPTSTTATSPPPPHTTSALSNRPPSVLLASIHAALCGECESKAAEVKCEHCSELYCLPCCAAVHRKGRRRLHSHYSRVLPCGQCEVNCATMECKECGEYFCNSCVTQVHSRGARRNHRDIAAIDPQVLRVVKHDGKNNVGIDATMLTFQTTMASLDEQHEMNDVENVMVEEECTMMADMCRKEKKLFIQVDSPALPEDVCTHVEVWMRVANPSFFSNQSLIANTTPKTGGGPSSILPYKPDLLSYTQDFSENLGINDRAFHLVVTAVAKHRSLLSRMLVSCEHADVGMYVFQLYNSKSKKWQMVVVDSLLPHSNNQPVLGRNADRSLWSALLEKAYAQLIGSYQFLSKSNATSMDETERLLKSMTGGDLVTFVNLRRDEYWWIVQQVTSQGLVCILAKDQQWGAGSTVLTSVEVTSTMLEKLEAQTPHQQQQSNRNNLKSSPVMLPSLPYRLIKLHNIYGPTDFHSETWNDSMPVWNRTLRDITQHHKIHEKIQWTSVEEASQHYNSILIASNFFASDMMYPTVYFQMYKKFEVFRAAYHARQILIVVEEKSNLPEVHSPRVARRPSEIVRKVLRTKVCDMEPNEMDLGDETDDEQQQSPPDGIGRMTESNPMNQFAVSAGGNIRSVVSFKGLMDSTPGITLPQQQQSEKHVTLNVQVTQPRIKFGVDCELQLFRIAGTSKQKCVEVPIVDGPHAGKMSAVFPTHNKLAAEWGTATESSTFDRRAKLELLPGHYILAVVPISNGGEHGGVLDAARFMVCLKREGFFGGAGGGQSVFEWRSEDLGSHAEPM